MTNPETVSDLAEQIADWLGVYGGCPNGDTSHECTFDKETNIFSCRHGFVAAMEERIRESVENEKMEEKILKFEILEMS